MSFTPPPFTILFRWRNRVIINRVRWNPRQDRVDRRRLFPFSAGVARRVRLFSTNLPMADSTHNEAKASRSILLDLPPPPVLARELRHLPGLVFLDSSTADPGGPEAGTASAVQERYSLIAADPVRVHEGNLFHEPDFEKLSAAWSTRAEHLSETPDLGVPREGLYGYVGYEGDFVFGEYEDCLVYNHRTETWIETGTLSRRRRPAAVSSIAPECLPFRAVTSREEFCAKVERAQEYIAAGDIYQVNLSHRFEAPVSAGFDAFRFHETLREQSPAPFAAFLSLGDREIASSSPELFLGISGDTIRTRPIKGTRPRFRDRELDEKSAYDLLTSSKEVAELIMITDLERNDLGQICEFGSVEATELLKLERFAQVFHLVSTVSGTLRPEVGPVEALRACFPGGSITGAPKKRAREIIEELESVSRGVYTGAIGCLGFNGECLFSIAIRTAVREGDLLHFHVGAGIVADSDPEMEWEETLHKAEGILRAGRTRS